jgi:DNA-3-methyladenine glycosylase
MAKSLKVRRGGRLESLGADFFARDTITVARELIGTTLVVGGCKGRIVETEAYTTDAASHAVMRQKQAALMGDTFGHVYVYLIYGMYYCLNFTTERTGVGAVLIRAVEPTSGIEEMIARRGATDLKKLASFKKLASGPGRLCQAFGIDARFNGQPVGREIKLIERDCEPQISSSPRIGITRATELEWRFYETGNPFVSRLP